MRLLTAIPLLFWAGTSAMAQLAVLWATEPAAAVTHAPPQDPALDSTSSVDVCARISPAPVYPAVAFKFVASHPERTTTAQPYQPEFGSTQFGRILAASRLLANPPPFGV